MSKTNIYVLLLEGGRYYVGKSDNVLRRYQQHLNGKGCAWTQKYKPVSLEKTLEGVSVFEEDKITKEYMSDHGIANVRGGSYVEIELAASQIAALQKEIWAAKDLCTGCGSSGHFVKDCYAAKNVSGGELYDESSDADSCSSDDDCDDDYDVEWACEKCDRTFTTESACIKHENYCGGRKRMPCYRCGREGHYASDCFASRHVRGYYLR